MPKAARILLFVLIELIFYPVTMIGVLLYMGVIIFHNRPRDISGTAYEPHMSRVLFHELGMRADPAAARLATALPASHPVIWGLMMGPTRLAFRVSGYLPGLLSYPPEPSEAGDSRTFSDLMTLRTAFMDRTLEDALPEVGQVVILGAGWDTRAYALPASYSGAVYEVDTPATQTAKLAALKKAGIDASHVTFVEVDFNTTTWLAALTEHGFDASIPTFLLWEGVTMYLTEAAIRDTVQAVASLAGGSRIAFDYFPMELIRGEKPHRLLGRVLPASIKLTYGEPFIGGITMQPTAGAALASYVEAQGLELLESDFIENWYGFALAGTPV